MSQQTDAGGGFGDSLLNLFRAPFLLGQGLRRRSMLQVASAAISCALWLHAGALFTLFYFAYSRLWSYKSVWKSAVLAGAVIVAEALLGFVVSSGPPARTGNNVMGRFQRFMRGDDVPRATSSFQRQLQAKRRALQPTSTQNPFVTQPSGSARTSERSKQLAREAFGVVPEAPPPPGGAKQAARQAFAEMRADQAFAGTRQDQQFRKAAKRQAQMGVLMADRGVPGVETAESLAARQRANYEREREKRREPTFWETVLGRSANDEELDVYHTPEQPERPSRVAQAAEDVVDELGPI